MRSLPLCECGQEKGTGLFAHNLKSVREGLANGVREGWIAVNNEYYDLVSNDILTVGDLYCNNISLLSSNNSIATLETKRLVIIKPLVLSPSVHSMAID